MLNGNFYRVDNWHYVTSPLSTHVLTLTQTTLSYVSVDIGRRAGEIRSHSYWLGTVDALQNAASADISIVVHGVFVRISCTGIQRSNTVSVGAPQAVAIAHLHPSLHFQFTEKPDDCLPRYNVSDMSANRCDTARSHTLHPYSPP